MKLRILTVAAAVIACTRVAALPGRVVPLPVLILLAELAACTESAGGSS